MHPLLMKFKAKCSRRTKAFLSLVPALKISKDYCNYSHVYTISRDMPEPYMQTPSDLRGLGERI